MQNLPYYALSALVVLITLTVHEYAHAFAAYKMGDPTARNLGRLTLNPLKHLDPLGALCMLFLHVGWAKPVPINARNFKKPRQGFAITALAGPLVNLVIAFFSAFIYLALYSMFSQIDFATEFLLNLAKNTLLFFNLLHVINLGIALFNLIPVPPLDGSRILGLILPPKLYFSIMRHERTIYFVLLGWLFVGNIISDVLLSFGFIASNPILSVFASIISLSNLLGYAIEGLSWLMMSFWRLLPFI